jgi:transcriptional regulator of arginine metabolism
VAKVDGRYVLPEALEGAPMLKPADHLAEIRETVSWVRPAGPYLLVAGTPAGLAAAAGVAIDRLGWPEVVGTIAGDDTLFIATAGRREQASVEARLSRLIREKAHV